MLNISGYIEESIVDGPGVRFVLFVQGCPHHCVGCHNEHTWSFDEKKLVTCDVIFEIIKKNPLTKGITFSGGEPLCQSDELIELASKCKQHGYNVMVYTGYTYEDIRNNKLLDYVDYLVDGKFMIDKRSLNCIYRGSTNQRIIDVQRSKVEGKTIEVNYKTFSKGAGYDFVCK